LNGIVLLGEMNQLQKEGMTDVLQVIFAGHERQVKARTYDSYRCIPRIPAHGTQQWRRRRSSTTRLPPLSSAA